MPVSQSPPRDILAPYYLAEQSELGAFKGFLQFLPTGTDSLGWNAAPRATPPRPLRKYTFLFNFRGEPATRIAVCTTSSADDARRWAWSSLTEADRARIKTITLITSGDASGAAP
jgi:hypothetical protein